MLTISPKDLQPTDVVVTEDGYAVTRFEVAYVTEKDNRIIATNKQRGCKSHIFYPHQVLGIERVGVCKSCGKKAPTSGPSAGTWKYQCHTCDEAGSE